MDATAALIIANIGTIGAVLYAAGKVVWWIAKLDSKVDVAHSMAVRAHKRIDEIKVSE